MLTWVGINSGPKDPGTQLFMEFYILRSIHTVYTCTT